MYSYKTLYFHNQEVLGVAFQNQGVANNGLFLDFQTMGWFSLLFHRIVCDLIMPPTYSVIDINLVDVRAEISILIFAYNFATL